MKKIELLFEQKTKVDSKSILNRLNKKVDNSILDKIEKGVTIEDIDDMVKLGLPILKYHTQITIHGLFDTLENNYIFGYKNIFQNKNKSIGIKYNAIDEEKRKRIAKRLAVLGFRYTRNSTDTKFSIVKVVNEDNYSNVITEMKGLKDKTNTGLFYGKVYLWAGEMWGQKYLILDLYINAIYERNIEQFLNELGATQVALEQKETEHKVYWDNYKKEQEIERKKEQEIRANEMLLHKKELDYLESNFKRVEKTQESGTYIQRVFDYNDKLRFKIVYVYLPKRAKKPRYNATSFETVEEALAYKPNESYSDTILNRKLTGYKL